MDGTAQATDRLRIGDAERDAMSAALQEHFTQGRLTRDELDERLTTAMTARTVAELRPLSLDLPEPRGLPAAPAAAVTPAALATPAGRRPGPGHARPPMAAPLIGMLVVAAIVLTGPGAEALTGFRPPPVFWLIFGAIAFHSLRRRRRRRRRRPAR